MITHNITDMFIYPRLHFWTINPNNLNIYSNIPISIGDKIAIKNREFEVVKDLDKKGGIRVAVQFGGCHPHTLYYSIRLKPINHKKNGKST